jgi:predicted alpha/beta superfamily hydrolase
VYLPPGYDASAAAGKRYPVLYMHDGQNVFDATTSFTRVEWAADEAAERLIAARRIRPLIIVAIANTAARMNEYTAARDEKHGGGKGDEYLRFMVETLKPFIDRTYRTQPQRENTATAGSSLGGWISLYAVMKRPDVFGAAGVVSPALFWADRWIIRFVGDSKSDVRPRLWIDIGTAEAMGNNAPDSMSPDAACRALVERLTQRGYRPESDFHFEVIDGGGHSEGDWAARFDRILVYLFPND